MISSHVRSYVHHLLIYLCITPLADADVGVSVSCGDINDDQFPTVAECQASTVIGGWAVGGEVGSNAAHNWDMTWVVSGWRGNNGDMTDGDMTWVVGGEVGN